MACVQHYFDLFAGQLLQIEYSDKCFRDFCTPFKCFDSSYFFVFVGFRRNRLPFLAAHATRICQVKLRQLGRRERKTQTRQKGKKLSEGREKRPGWKQCSGNSEVAQMQTQRRFSDYVIFKSYIILPNKVVKEVEKAGEEKNFSWLKTVRSIADRRLVSVLGITVMVMII